MPGKFAKVKGPLKTKTPGMRVKVEIKQKAVESIPVTMGVTTKHPSESGHPIGVRRRRIPRGLNTHKETRY